VLVLFTHRRKLAGERPSELMLTAWVSRRHV
jgi:hypothetical protein